MFCNHSEICIYSRQDPSWHSRAHTPATCCERDPGVRSPGMTLGPCNRRWTADLQRSPWHHEGHSPAAVPYPSAAPGQPPLAEPNRRKEVIFGSGS